MIIKVYAYSSMGSKLNTYLFLPQICHERECIGPIVPIVTEPYDVGNEVAVACQLREGVSHMVGQGWKSDIAKNVHEEWKQAVGLKSKN